ncbi:MAG: carbonic anhydrase [Fibrobacteraceae bacterium]|nr:carbonic anhydrase [Fibrobacteraceae bacterium]
MILSAAEAIAKLKEGNKFYVDHGRANLDISPELRKSTLAGQKPFAIIVGCSDSRAIPECIFNAALGELFVIRIAGNVIDDHQLGSIEYATEHLGVKLIVVLGHDRCGAVDAAMNHDPDGYIKYITDEISAAIGDEKDEVEACKLNALESVRIIESNLDIQRFEHNSGLVVKAALYHLESGVVEFL